MKRIKFGVVVFPGTNCDRDTAWVTKEVLSQDTRMIWHTESDIDDIDVIIIPGGFSYGDYLRAGAIAGISPVLKAVKQHAAKGKHVLGICNGWQVLTETGLVRGAFLRNKNPHFLCQHQSVRVVNNNTAFTSLYNKDEILTVPIAHAEGNFYLTDDGLKAALDKSLIAFQYSDNTGTVNDDTNPNGSTANIAGIFNDDKNVLGMMPHPERASEKELGSEDGKKVFESLIQWLQK